MQFCTLEAARGSASPCGSGGPSFLTLRSLASAEGTLMGQAYPGEA